MATREPRLCAPPPSSHFDLSRARPNNARSPSSPRLVLAPLVVTVHVGAPVDAANHDGRVSIARPSPPLSASSAETDSTRSRTCRTSCSVRRPSGSGSACRTRATSRTLSGSRLRRFNVSRRGSALRAPEERGGEQGKRTARRVDVLPAVCAAHDVVHLLALQVRALHVLLDEEEGGGVEGEGERGGLSSRFKHAPQSASKDTHTLVERVLVGARGAAKLVARCALDEAELVGAVGAAAGREDGCAGQEEVRGRLRGLCVRTRSWLAGTDGRKERSKERRADGNTGWLLRLTLARSPASTLGRVAARLSRLRPCYQRRAARPDLARSRFASSSRARLRGFVPACVVTCGLQARDCPALSLSSLSSQSCHAAWENCPRQFGEGPSLASRTCAPQRHTPPRWSQSRIFT